MIERILPDQVIVVESREDLLDAPLHPAERAVVGNAVEKRRREFTTGRTCARAALAQLGLPEQPIPTGERGEPCWPEGVVGSITHCEGYRGCAAAHAAAVVTVGIDAEPNAPLPEGVCTEIARPEELPRLRELAQSAPQIHWDRLLFSAKESVYKAWFPLAQRWLGFEDAVLTIDPAAGTFHARLLVEGPSLSDGTARLRELSGRWLVQEGLVLTAIALLAPASRSLPSMKSLASLGPMKGASTM